MSAIGMCALLASSITPSSVVAIQNTNSIGNGDEVRKEDALDKLLMQKKAGHRSASVTPVLYSYVSNPKETIERYVFGFHAKTKRSLAEEAESGDDTSLCSWIRDGCDPNECDAYGYSPLLNASVIGRLNAVVELIKNGADVNKVGPYGFTALHAAAQNGHREIVFVLLKHQADINAQNDDMDTAMHLAIRSVRIEIVYMLLRHGGETRVKGFGDKDCVQTARDCGLKDVAKTLANFNSSIGYHPHSAPEFRRQMTTKN